MPWLIFPQKRITSRDFSNQQGVLTAFADVAKMHNGRNTAHVQIETPMQILEVCIQVNRSYKGKNIKNALRSDGRPPKAVVRYLYHLLLAYLNESHEETELFSQMDQCLEENMKKYPASSGLFLYRVWLLAKQERIDEAKKLLAWYSSNLTRISTKRQQEEYLMTLYLQWELTKKEHDKKEAASAALELQKQTDSLVASLVWLMTERDLSDAEKLRQCERLYRIYGAKPIIYAYCLLYTSDAADE